MRNFTEYEKNEARKNTFVLIGMTGNGKSQIIKFLTGDKNVKVSDSKSSCTSYANLYYSSIKNDANNEKFVCFIDTAGFCDSKGSNQDRNNYNNIKNILIDNKCEIKGIFIVENFQTERVNGEDKKIFKCASDLFPIKNFWDYITIIFTHYYDKGSKKRGKIKKKQEEELSNILEEIIKDIHKRINSIRIIDQKYIHRLYIDIDDDTIERKYDLSDEDEKGSYENGTKELQLAKKELYREIFEKIRMDPIYDEVKYDGTEDIIIRLNKDFFNYNLYEATIETRKFYSKGKLISLDIISCYGKQFKETISKVSYGLRNIGKGLILGNIAIFSPLTKGILYIKGEDFDITETLQFLANELFPKTSDTDFREKIY